MMNGSRIFRVLNGAKQFAAHEGLLHIFVQMKKD
jgi:hypothetical protein